MSKEKIIKIDGVEVRLVKFSPMIGMPILARLQNMLGGSIVNMAGGMKASQEDQLKIIGETIDSLSDRVPPEKMSAFIEDVLTSGFIFIGGQKVTHIDDFGAFDDSDPYYVMVMTLKEQITFSFGGFLGKFMAGQNS
jgi:hypothetical protein